MPSRNENAKQQHEQSSLCSSSKPQIKEIRWYYAVCILLNGSIESNTLNIPFIYNKTGGILVVVALQVVLLPILFGTMVVLVVSAKAKNCLSYQDVMRRYIGLRFSLLTSVFISAYLLGSTISYFVAIADQWQQLVLAIRPDLIEPSPWYVNRKFLLCATSLGTMLPLSFYKKIDSLKYPSSIAFLVYLYCSFLIIIKYFTGVNSSKVGRITAKPETFFSIISGIPNFAVLYDSHLQVLLLFGNRENGKPEHLKALIVTAIASFVFYNLIGIFGFLTFGSCVHADILLSYQPTPEVLIATFGIVVKLALAYPITSLVARHVTYFLLENMTKKDFELMQDSEELKFRVVVSILWFCASMLTSLIFKDIDKIAVLTGGLMLFLSLIFPGILMMKYSLTEFTDNNSKIFGILFSIVSVSLGSAIFVLSTAERIFRYVHFSVEDCNSTQQEH